MNSIINSKKYWEDRFRTDWEDNHGREQTKCFTQLCIDNLPEDFKEILQENLSILDWGCALGDGTALLQQSFVNLDVTGVDISDEAINRAKKEYPQCKFRSGDIFLEDKKYNIIYTSNCLEHFTDAIKVLNTLSAFATDYLIVMVPFEEYEGIPEHVTTFLYSNIPLSTGDHSLIYQKVIPTGMLREAQSAGQQILLIYAHKNAVKKNTLNTNASALLGDFIKKSIHDQTTAQLVYDKEQLVHDRVQLEIEYQNVKKKSNDLLYERNFIENQLHQVYASALWKISHTLAKIIERMHLTTPIKGLLFLKKYGFKMFIHAIITRIAQGISHFFKGGKKRISPVHNPYEQLLQIKDLNVSVIEQQFSLKDKLPSYTIVTPIKDEENAIIEFLESIVAQTYLPMEVILIDGGSKDKTTSLIKEFAKKSSVSIKLIELQNVNIAIQRNRGIRESLTEIIVFADCGCVLDTEYTMNMVGPFMDSEVDLVGGVYLAMHPSKYSKLFVSDWKHKANWNTFLPGGACTAVKKSLALQIGGYPEFLTLTGEDTYFDIQYRRISKNWVINKKAFVLWDTPNTAELAERKIYLYNRGDAESGVSDSRFYHLKDTSPYIVKYTHPELYIPYQGYLEGRTNRPMIEFVRRKLKGLVIIYTGVPFTDSGGGQRSTQLALSYMRAGYKVIFISIYGSSEEKKPIYLDMDSSLLELYYADDCSIKDICNAYKTYVPSPLLIVELPHSMALSFIKSFKLSWPEGSVIYDYIDNWNSSLGGSWYNTDVEKEIIAISDYLTASATALMKNLQTLTSKEVTLLPNAVNRVLFNPTLEYTVPPDLPIGKPIALYIGAMWGEWFDWELIMYCAINLPDWNFVFIGEAPLEKKKQFKQINNVYFLGLKPQFDLPQYIYYSNTCLYPFKKDHITKYVNPLKIYEYVAMKKPVVAENIPEIRHIPATFFSDTYEEFATCIKQSSQSAFDQETVADFINHNNWDYRVQEIQNLIT